MRRIIDISAALTAGSLCHLGFVAAVAVMAYSLANGMQNGIGALPPAWALAADVLLAAQFPLLHSSLLSGPGRRWLARLVPGRRGSHLATTNFVVLASLQVLATFVLWTPSGVVLAAPRGSLAASSWLAFGASWIFLGLAILQAGPGLQSGATGWWTLLRDQAPPRFPMPSRGIFRFCRQPIYLGFLLVLWTAPRWSLDRLVLCALWSPYCVFGPRLKERRFSTFYGQAFTSYQLAVPYMIPRLRSLTPEQE